MAGPIKYDTKQKQLLSQLIDTIFTEAELDRFCERYASPVVAEFAQGMDKAEKTHLLIEHFAGNDQLGKLVIHIKSVAPQEYEAFVRQVQGNKGSPSASQRVAAPATSAIGWPASGERCG